MMYYCEPLSNHNWVFADPQRQEMCFYDAHMTHVNIYCMALFSLSWYSANRDTYVWQD